ncbi:fasciclin-3 isoform X1 [Colletes gigas]|uniref:fasciclin-3 isoform X1 n=1 Tax=Colletes gigas TaxID=935657 RepID=UPI001C9B2C22|nr:fasciclin-3 isoform X1 [Colletes gigas]
MCMKTMSHFKMTIAWVCLIGLLCSTAVKGSKSTLVVDIEPKRQTAVRLGESLQILCRVGRPLQVCRVEIPGEGGGLVLSKGQLPEDGIEYYGEGTEVGQCGVNIAKIKESHDGMFKCTLTPTDNRAEAEASMRIIVAKPPNSPELHTSPGSYGTNTYRKGEKLEVSCIAPSGRPAANVSLFLDDEPIGNEERPTIYDTSMDDISLAVQNATRSLDWTDNGKVLRCVASHIALDKPKETTMQLIVYYPPQPQPTIERFGYVIGRQGIVNVTVYANPKPRFLWRVNDEKINEGFPDDSNRLETSTAVDLGRGAWSVILTIDSVQKSDTEKEYILEAHNHEGAYEYRIVLSTSTEPAGAFSYFYGKLSEHMHALGVDLDAGSIIGIVVGALVLVLVVFLLIFARATGRWCFAGSSMSRNLGESRSHIFRDFADAATTVNLLHFEKSKTADKQSSQRSDTESAGRYSRTEVDGSSQGRKKSKISFTRLFKRNKDKVSGADTDTMRTVITIDDEKLQTTAPSAQDNKSNPTTGEGGIVYAELDLTQQQQGVTPRRLNEDKTEYAEILYTKPATEEETPNE